MADPDALPTFTKSTPNPRSGADYSGKDEPITRPVLPYEYTDMRGNHWLVQWTGSAWTSTPTAQTVEAYKAYTMDDGSPLVRKGMFNAATTAPDLIDGIEERIEAARARGLSKPFPWWLVIAALAALHMSKKRR
jgi:hypothetical protein